MFIKKLKIFVSEWGDFRRNFAFSFTSISYNKNYLSKLKVLEVTFVQKMFLTGTSVVKNPPWNAGDSGSIPSWGTEIPHAEEQLSPLAKTTEAGAAARESPCQPGKIARDAREIP